MRAIAILLVVYSHGAILLPKELVNDYNRFIPGIDGVSIFFVLSGYLIGNILLRIIQKSEFGLHDLFNFWIRRWFRTLPNYFLILGVLTASLFLMPKIIYGKMQWPYLLFSQNLFTAHPLFFPEAWSLSIEEWFYLLFPITCFLGFKFLKNKKRTILFSALFFIILPLVLRFIGYYFNLGTNDWDLNYRKVVIFRLDSLMYGILGAYLFSFKYEYWRKYKNICLITGLSMILAMTVFSRLHISLFYLIVGRYTLESIATLLLLPFLSEVKNIKFKVIARAFTFISVISYSMYLINLTLVQGIMIPKTMSFLGLKETSLNSLFIFKSCLFWFYTIALSFLIYRFYEKPFTELREKITFQKNKTATPAPLPEPSLINKPSEAE